MKRILPLVFLLVFCTTGLAVENSFSPIHKDTVLGIVFPKTLAGLEFDGVTEYKEPELGYSLRYKGPNFIKADVYVYDKGIPGIPNGCNSKIVKSEAESVRVLLEIMQKRGKYKDVVFLNTDVVPQKGRTQFLRHCFEYIQQGDSASKDIRVSERFLTGYAGKFVKISLTYIKKNSRTGQKTSVQLVEDLAQILNRATDENWTRLINPSSALKAIAIFEANPLGENAEGALSIIINFANQSDEVLITIGPWASPWISKGGKEYKHSSTLLGAFIAGNIKAQITNGIRNDHPYEGILQIIATYKQLMKANATEDIPSIEKWIELQKSGKLKAVIKKQSNKQIKDD